MIRLAFPELTEERRKGLVKDIKKMAEEAKVAIRNVRRDEMDEAKALLKNRQCFFYNTNDKIAVINKNKTYTPSKTY